MKRTTALFIVAVGQSRVHRNFVKPDQQVEPVQRQGVPEIPAATATRSR